MKTGFTEINEFFSLYKESAWHKDTTAMLNLYGEQAVIFDMWDQCYHSTAEWNQSISDWLGSLGEEKVNVEFERITIHQAGNTGFASALIRFRAISSEGTVVRSMTNRITLGFSRSEDGWKVTHQHTSAPIRSDDLTAILDR
jgi:ketosteroid isomerase-like protein